MPVDRLRNIVLVATYVSAGVKVGGGGFVIVNGKVIKVPPRGPLSRQLQDAIQAVVASAKAKSR